MTGLDAAGAGTGLPGGERPDGARVPSRSAAREGNVFAEARRQLAAEVLRADDTTVPTPLPPSG
ncbi:hypothetical protein [Peterkaempfera griseoplana]|uniref:hypothetical protein n=1 Tax=Peterkaempfera griseoplana TaxID=66896 RepID=UPI0006E3AF6B|nr:hypothetical protein [Peterkaempfera griseoplana]